MSDRRFAALQETFRPDWPGLVDNIMRRGTPERVYFIELFQDGEIRSAIAERFGLMADMQPSHPDYERWKMIRVQRFCGYDFVRMGLVDQIMPFQRTAIEDTAGLKRSGGRDYVDEHHGPVQSWDDLRDMKWPDPLAPDADRELKWFQKNLPEDMCIIGSGGFGHMMEWLSWLMGYETLCFALFEQRDLVEAISSRLSDYFATALERILTFDRVKIIWGSDDMGFKNGLLISPADMRSLVLSGHKRLAEMSHRAGLPYLLHSCGKLNEIMDELIDDVRIDARHSFEDTIEDVRDAKRSHGSRLAMLGGIDLDFLCRSDEASIRRRVRDTLDVCQPGGGYCLGTGNSVANYVPLDNYLIMLDEGRRYGR